MSRNGQLSESELIWVAEFSCGTDMYNLCLTAKHPYFTQRYFERQAIEDDGRDGKEGKDDGKRGGVGTTPRTFASALIHRAMRSWLDYILKTSFTKPRLVDDIIPRSLRGVPGGQAPAVVIAGSMVLQAAIGRRWADSDVDVFCTWSAAPAIRRSLVQQCDFICTGNTVASTSHGGKEDYGDFSRCLQQGSGSVTNIDHLETYITRPKDKETEEEFLRKTDKYDLTTMEGKRGFLRGESWYCRTYSFARACLMGDWAVNTPATGYNSHKMKVGHPGGVGGEGGFPLAKDAERENCRGKLELIIAKENIDTPLAIVSSFDIIACKTSFDGTTFRIPNPHETFAGGSRIEETRHNLLSKLAVAEAVLKTTDFKRLWVNESVIVEYMTELGAPWGDIGFPPYSQEQEAKLKELARGTVDGPLPRWMDPAVKAREATDEELVTDFYSDATYFKLLQRLVVRLQRYHNRGLTIIDPPPGIMYYQTKFHNHRDGGFEDNRGSPPPLPGGIEAMMREVNPALSPDGDKFLLVLHQRDKEEILRRQAARDARLDAQTWCRTGPRRTDRAPSFVPSSPAQASGKMLC